MLVTVPDIESQFEKGVKIIFLMSKTVCDILLIHQVLLSQGLSFKPLCMNAFVFFEIAVNTSNISISSVTSIKNSLMGI